MSDGYTRYALNARETAYFEAAEICHDEEVAAIGNASLWKMPPSDSRPGAWGGVIDVDVNGLGTVGATLTLRLPGGNTGEFLIHRITAETRVQISGSGVPPF